jgi:ribokinase
MSEDKRFDIVSVGGATQDVFVRTDLSKIMRIEDLFSKTEFMCFSYGSKLNVDEIFFGIGGGALNTSTNFANLGFKAAPVIKIGNDGSGQEILKRLKERNVYDELVHIAEDCKTGFSVVLNSYEGDRTVLTYRGANSRMTIEDINMDIIKQAKWIYVSSLSGDSNTVLDPLADFAEDNGVHMAFNPGSTQIKRGLDGLKRILEETEFLILNKEEAANLTGIKENFRHIERDKCTGCKTCVDICPANIFRIDDNGKAEHFGKRETCVKGCELCVTHCPEVAISVSPWASNIDEQLLKLKSFGPKVVVITDGSRGVQVYDGQYRYLMPSYKVPVRSTLGAGDCFASTFTAAMINTNWDIPKSVRYAAANSANVVQEYGAQRGFKTFSELDKFIADQAEKSEEINHVAKKNIDIANNSENTASKV